MNHFVSSRAAPAPQPPKAARAARSFTSCRFPFTSIISARAAAALELREGLWGGAYLVAPLPPLSPSPVLPAHPEALAGPPPPRVRSPQDSFSSFPDPKASVPFLGDHSSAVIGTLALHL